MLNRSLIFILIIVLFSSCVESEKERVTRLVKEWDGKQILFPQNQVFTIQGRDTVNFYFQNFEYKIITYVDSLGCTNCKLQLERWKTFMQEVDSIKNVSVPFVFVFHPKNVKELRNILRGHAFDYPVFFDEKDDFNALNRFPDDMMFQTFLLDKDNKVQVIGNPVLNPQVKELYIGKVTGKGKQPDAFATKMTVDRTDYDFGTFPMSERQECVFRITNTGSSLLMVQDVVTSCGCTKVEYDKHPVPPGRSMDLKVIYEAEESGHFTKVVTVYSNAETTPVRLRITGNVK